MKFEKTNNIPNAWFSPVTGRWEMSNLYKSENGVWMIGNRHKMFGKSVAILNEEADPLFDYCCADDVKLLSITQLAIVLIMEKYPENITLKELRAVLPDDRGPRPINQPGGVFPQILEMSGLANAIVSFQSITDVIKILQEEQCPSKS